jgi:hypothetical protein
LTCNIFNATGLTDVEEQGRTPPGGPKAGRLQFAAINWETNAAEVRSPAGTIG